MAATTSAADLVLLFFLFFCSCCYTCLLISVIYIYISLHPMKCEIFLFQTRIELRCVIGRQMFLSFSDLHVTCHSVHFTHRLSRSPSRITLSSRFRLIVVINSSSIKLGTNVRARVDANRIDCSSPFLLPDGIASDAQTSIIVAAATTHRK